MKWAYVQGAMVGGIASDAMVVRMAEAGLLGFWGSGGLPVDRVEASCRLLSEKLGTRLPWGMNLLCNLQHPEVEMRSVDLYLKYGVTRVEAAAFMTMTPALVAFRVSGLASDGKGGVSRRHHVFAKISRLEVARKFLAPPPENLVERLVQEGRITREQAELARKVPMAEDVTVEADSGGHTDRGVAITMLPAFRKAAAEERNRHGYATPIRIGAAGGLGTPEAVAAMFLLGADYVVTGSVNQCTAEAGTSDLAKDLLSQASMADTDMAPAADMFEVGAEVQVLKKGTFFPARGRKLFELWKRHASLEEIEEKERLALEKNVFKRTIPEVWEEVKAFFGRTDPSQIEKAEANPKHKMALVFRWYMGLSSRNAIMGTASWKTDFQIHTGPALGAFNEWVRGTRWEPWRDRHVDEIAGLLMNGAARVMNRRHAAILTGEDVGGIEPPA